MGDTRRQLPDGSHFFLLKQLGLGRFQLFAGIGQLLISFRQIIPGLSQGSNHAVEGI